MHGTHNGTFREAVVAKINSGLVLVLDPVAEGAPVEVARGLCHARRLPPHAAYVPHQSASRWLAFSVGEAQIREHYEAGAWEKLGLKAWASSTSSPDALNFVGLGPGEGLGEVELLRKILADGGNVHYLAVDLSASLLAAHAEIIRDVFGQELKEGRLRCAGVVGNIFGGLREARDKARDAFQKEGTIEHQDAFLPTRSGVIVSFLGNCLGNEEGGREGEFFSSVMEVFDGYAAVCFLVGVSVKRDAPDEYTRSWFDFLLETPRHLLVNLKLLRSQKPSGNTQPDEFTIPEDGAELSERLPEVRPQPYSTTDGVRGQVYRFTYRLAFDLEMPSEGVLVPSGTTILLYTIIKYDLASLLEFLRNRGFGIRHDPAYHQRVDTTNGFREYAVFAALSSSTD